MAKVDGVESQKVEINNHRAVVTVKNTETFGKAVPTVKNSFPVLGMTCVSCAGSAESIVKYEPDVIEASVNYAILSTFPI